MRIELKRILCPVDLSPTSDHAIRYAVTLAENFGAELALLHVLGIPATAMCDYYGLPGLESDLAVAAPYRRASPEDAQQKHEPFEDLQEDRDADEGAALSEDPDESRDHGLEELAESLRADHDCTITTHLKEGRPFLETINTARETNADLIVMGTHGRTGLAHMLIGSTAEKVVRMAPCPVLTVKHPEHEFVMP